MSRLKPRPPGLRDAAQTVTAVTELISEYEDAASNTYNPGTTPGQAGSDSTGTLLYQHGDHLTTRLTTENNGDLSNRQGHYPYGESWYEALTANPSVLRKYTTYLRDDETVSGKLNYAVFRQHSARVGRFLMVDPRSAGSTPQALNGYSDFGNDPVGRPSFYTSNWPWCPIWDPWCEDSGGNTGGRPGGYPPCYWSRIGCDEPNGGVGTIAIPIINIFEDCWAKLKYRSVVSTIGVEWRYTHSFWNVNLFGQHFVVSGGPTGLPFFSNLDVWVDPGDNGIHVPADTMISQTHYYSGIPFLDCVRVGVLLVLAYTFPNDVIYVPDGPNSNSAARYLGWNSGFTPSKPPRAGGWDTLIHGR